MVVSADTWLVIRYPDATCGGTGYVAVSLTPRSQCPDCRGSGLDERRIQADSAKGLIPKWVLEQRTRFSQ
jgi:predicted Zn-ribbon and HTH transcriptional regulator